MFASYWWTLYCQNLKLCLHDKISRFPERTWHEGSRGKRRQHSFWLQCFWKQDIQRHWHPAVLVNIWGNSVFGINKSIPEREIKINMFWYSYLTFTVWTALRGSIIMPSSSISHLYTFISPSSAISCHVPATSLAVISACWMCVFTTVFTCNTTKLSHSKT